LFDAYHRTPESDIVWAGVAYELPKDILELDAQQATPFLRPDFEDENRKDFCIALGLYHNYQYTEAGRIVDSFSQQYQGRSPAASTSFKILRQLISRNTPCIWEAPETYHWYKTSHVEDLIASVAECSREWVFRTRYNDISRKTVLEDFLAFALYEIREWVFIPPVEGTAIPDMNVRQINCYSAKFVLKRLLIRVGLWPHIISLPCDFCQSTD
jgi:hypothetical protein